MRRVFTGGMVFDGTGAAPARADVAVEGDRIVTVYQNGVPV
jgi:N-acyl-D-aspartate/D-glutamate deacylase